MGRRGKIDGDGLVGRVPRFIWGCISKISGGCGHFQRVTKLGIGAEVGHWVSGWMRSRTQIGPCSMWVSTCVKLEFTRMVSACYSL
jgi:hypothetical protein